MIHLTVYEKYNILPKFICTYNERRHSRTSKHTSQACWRKASPGTPPSTARYSAVDRPVLRRLNEGGLRFLRSGVRPFSSVHHDRMRKEFARIGKDLYVERWLELFFIDESHFETVHRPNRRNTGEWCGAGEKPEADMTVKHPGRVNAAMGLSGRGYADIHCYRTRFNAGVFVGYINDVYVPAMRRDGAKVLMMDNDRSHHSRAATAACAAAGITKCNPPPPPCWKAVCDCPFPAWPWFPAYCAQLSPQEIYFNHLKQNLDYLSERRGRVSQLDDLERRVRLVHGRSTAEYREKLYASMPARCASMYENDGARCTYK